MNHQTARSPAIGPMVGSARQPGGAASAPARGSLQRPDRTPPRSAAGSPVSWKGSLLKRIARHASAWLLGAAGALAMVPAVQAQSTNKYALCFALDKSGSMSTANWQLQVDGYRKALLDPATRFVPTDGSVSVAIVTFDANAQTRLVLTPVTPTSIGTGGAIRVALDNLYNNVSPGGNTAMGRGIAACTTALEAADPAAKQAIDMTTDGQNNTGTNPVTAATAAVAADVDAVNLLGIGNNVDEGQLTNVAAAGNGFWVRTPNFASFEAALKQKIKWELALVDVTITKTVTGLPPGMGLSAATSFGYSVTCSSQSTAITGTITVPAGGTTGTATVSLPPGATCSGFSETSRGSPPANYSWDTESVSASFPATISTATTTASITNPLTRNQVSVTITKNLIGEVPSGGAPGGYGFSLICDAVTYTGTVPLAASATTGSITITVPQGATCTSLLETGTAPLPANYGWGSTSITLPTSPITAGATGTITNTLVRNQVPVTINKTVTGAPTGGAGGSYGFTLGCNTGNVNGSVTVPAGAASGSATVNVPQGAVCNTLTETGKATAPENYSWGAETTTAPGTIGANGATGSISNLLVRNNIDVTIQKIVTGAPPTKGAPGDYAFELTCDTGKYSGFVSLTGTAVTGFATVKVPQGAKDCVLTETQKGPVPQHQSWLAETITNPPSPIATGATGTITNPLTPLADLSVVKTITPDPAVAGHEVTWTITVTNLGHSPASGVVATDAVPSTVTGLTFGGSHGSACVAGTPVRCNFGVLQPNDVRTFTITGTLAASATGQLENTVTVESGTPDPSTDNNSSTSTTDIINADLVIKKTNHVEEVEKGSEVTYDVTIQNTGKAEAADVAWTDNPTGLSIISITGPSGTCNTAGCTGITVPPLTTLTFTVKATVTGERGTTAINVVSMTGGDNCTEEVPCTARDEDRILAPNLGVTKDAPVLANVSGNQWTATYLVTVTNNGSAAGKYTLSDTPAFSPGVTLNSWTVTTAGGTLNPALPGSPSGQISGTDVSIAAEASHTYTVKIIFTTSKTATALTCTGTPGNGTFNTASITGTSTASDTSCGSLPGALGLSIAKTASVQQAASGDSFEYTITASNAGSTQATGNPTTIVDTLPAGIKVTGVTGGAGFTCTPSSALPLAGDGSTTTISCTSTTGVAGGAENVLVATLQVDKTSAGSVTNKAVVTSGDPGCSAEDPCAASVEVTDGPDPGPKTVVPVPTTSPEGLAALALMMLGVAGWASRRRRRDR